MVLNAALSVIVLPGSFSRPEFYFPVRDAVAERGIDIQVLPLSTVYLGQNDTRVPPSMHDDAAMIAQAVEELADAGRDVIVVAHSYSGIPLTEAAQGLGKQSRKQVGKTGGLVELAYLTAFVPGPEESAEDIRNKIPPGHEIPFGVDDNGWLFHSDPVRMAELAYSDLPPQEGLEWAKKFSNHSARSFADKVTGLGYLDEDLAVSYLVHEHDQLGPPSFQRELIKMVEELSGRAVSVTSIPAGHMSVVTTPDLVVDWIVTLANGK